MSQDLLDLKPISEEEKNHLLFGAPAPVVAAAEPVPGEGAPVIEPATAESAPVPELVKFTLDGFNSTFGTTFEQEDGLKDIISKGLKYSDIEKEKSDLARKVDELSGTVNKTLNPRSYFSSDDAYLREQLLLKNKENADAVKYLVDLTPTKIKSMSDYEALKYNMLINNPALDGGDAGAEELIQAQYDFDGDMESLTRITRNKMMLDAKEARKTLSSLYEGIEIPDTKSWESTQQSIRDNWSVPAKDLVDGITKLQLSEDLEFVVDPATKQGILEEVLNEVSKNRIDVNESAMRDIAGIVRTRLVERNLDNILKHVRTTATEAERERLRKEIHNDAPLNTSSGEGTATDVNTEALKNF